MLVIKSGRVISPGDGIDAVCDIFVENGVVAAIGSADEEGCEIIDAGGMIVAPGFIDAHSHFRQPGQTHKEDIQTGANAAKKGGFTTVIMMANTAPAVDNEEILSLVLELGKKTGINILSAAAISRGLLGEALTDMETLKKAGAAAFSDDGMPVMNAGFLLEAMRKAKSLDAVISLHEEDPALIEAFGIDETAPWIAEASMIARDMALALETGAKLHIQHVSSAESVKLIRFAKNLGIDVTAEVTPQHFSLTSAAVKTKGALAKLNPPLRGEKDRQSLIEGLKDGTIDIIATDHAPHSADEKAKPLNEAPSGIIGLETALALGITNLVAQERLTLGELIEKMTVNPAKRFGLNAGTLKQGKPADIVIFDENACWAVGKFASKSQNSPFIGDTLSGRVKYTICGGRIVFKGD